MPRPGFRLILKTAWFFSGRKGVSNITFEIGAEPSSPRIEEVSAIRGGLPSTLLFEPVFGWRGCSVLRDYRHSLPCGTASYKLCTVEIMS